MAAAASRRSPGCASGHEAAIDGATRAQTLPSSETARSPRTSTRRSSPPTRDQNILLALFEGLAAIDERTSQAVPAAAQSWESKADGLVWTQFHPGEADFGGPTEERLTADDFVQSWRRISLPALASEYSDLLYPIKNAAAFNQGTVSDPGVLGISAPDARTLRVELEHPTPYLPVLVALPPWFPVNPRVLEHFGAMSKRSTDWTRAGNLVGNGPFTLDEWTPNSRIVVAKNGNYWNADAVTLNQIVFFPNESADTEEKDFRAGQLHITYALPLAKIAAYRRESPDLLRVDPFLQTYFLRFNVQRAPFGDPRIRRALSLAINRDAIAHSVLSDAYPSAHAFTPDDCGGYTPRARVGLDVAEARRLLEAGGRDTRAGGGSGPSRCSVEERRSPAAGDGGHPGDVGQASFG